jgi:hypothetical protein
MRTWTKALTLALLAGISPTTALAQPADACAVDRTAALALDVQAFDQGPSGWRSLARPGCFLAAADLIAAWRAGNPGHSLMLRWHEGQMRAAGGAYAEAIPLFDSARWQGLGDAGVDTGWNLYVDATIAFLRRDRAALATARAALAALPLPTDQPTAAAFVRTMPPPARWPDNLDVVDGLVTCFDRSYADAMSDQSCRTPLLS